MIEFFDYELTFFKQGTAKAIEESISKKEITEFILTCYESRLDDVIRVLEIQELDYKDFFE